MTQHYSDKIIDAMEAKGWKDEGKGLFKVFSIPELAGEISPEGQRIAYAKFCERNRYLSSCIGWGTIVDVDGREFHNDPEGAVDALEDKLIAGFKK